MVGDAQSNSLMNVSSDVNASRKLFRQKDAQRFSLLCSGKWLQIVRGSPKVSCEVVSTSPSHFSSKVGENYEAESEKLHKKVIIPLSSKASFLSNYSQGNLQFTMGANGTPHFVFNLENQKDVYVANYVEDLSVYMIYLQRGVSSSSPNLVGRIKVSTLSSERGIEREFVLFSSNDQILSRGENRGLPNVNKKIRGISRLSRTSFIPDLCSWDQPFEEEPSFDVEQVNLFENNLPANLETLAVVVKQERVREESGGWGLNFLKKSPLVQSNDAIETETSSSVTSMDVVIPSGIHGGPEDGPLSLIERWKSQGNCDCGGWDLGCSLTHLNCQPRKDQFELFIEQETIGLQMVNVRGGVYFVQFEANLSMLQSFSIALAFIHSQKHRPKIII
ncbi:hypothetical protein CARUB_v10011182mg [Capsella rubella]|uniref:Uncharacterized protein n=1 Tax=Capsella rubella TaxID=81985 RepID=R0GSS0_9BRAS|nr:uncharacterized protein LOC17897654 [Capsella rubella]EOA38841.1 hypothetical protein CARUB_v10011182mg [Capsella rubella]